MKRNRVFRLLASLTVVVLCMTAFSVTAFAGGGAGGQAEGDREAAGGKGAAEIGGDDGAADGGRPTHLRRGDMIAFGRGGDAFIQKEIHQKGVFLLSDGKRQPGDTGDDIADTQTTQRKSTQVVKRTDGLLQGIAVSISMEDGVHKVSLLMITIRLIEYRGVIPVHSGRGWL